MNRLPGLIGCAVLVSATFALAGCGNGGSKFVGTWDCSYLDATVFTLTISHSGGDNYAGEMVPNKQLVTAGLEPAGTNKGPLTYKDGAMADPKDPKSKDGNITFDKKTGELFVNKGDGNHMTCKKIKG